ncbi:MAG: methionyl-tRNA formyltransferase [Bryobacteraceae bacterium]
MMRLVYLGTPAFAVPTLERIVEAGHLVLEVITQPDRPRGRGRGLAASPVKEAALRLGLGVYQPERVRRPEAVEHLRTLAPDAMVIVGYGQIIPQNIIDLAPHGIVNVHASLLPKYRGAGPIQWAIVNGETRTGVTTMRIDAGLDTGDMLLKKETEIGRDETAIELGRRLAAMGADLLVETLAGLGSIVPEKQDAAHATYAPILKKEDGLIDWHQSAQAIHNRVRGLQPWPGGYTTFRGQTLNIGKSAVGDLAPPAVLPQVSLPGRIVRTKPLLVACGEGLLELHELQIEGRKRLSAADFANGQRLSENEVLGEPRP